MKLGEKSEGERNKLSQAFAFTLHTDKKSKINSNIMKKHDRLMTIAGKL